MTSGNDRLARPQWLRSWAAEQLQLAGNAPPELARAKFCKLLEEADFVPAPALQDAAYALASETDREPRERRWSPWTVREYHDRLRAEVEQFAAEFFSLSCPERKQRWQDLLNLCEDAPHLIGRLSFLAIGLNAPAEIAPSTNPRAMELAGRIQAMFVLRPAERAYARQKLLAEAKMDLPLWEEGARELKSHNRQTAELELDLIDWLLSWRAREKQQHKAEQEAAARRAKLEKALRKSASGAPAGSGSYAYIIAIVVISGLVRLAGSGSSTPSHVPSYWQHSQPPSNLEFEKLLEGMRAQRQLSDKTREEMREAGIELPKDYYVGDAIETLMGRGEEVRARREKWEAYRKAKREREAAELERESYTGGSLPTNIPDSPTVP